jgi:hypothetical protein
VTCADGDISEHQAWRLPVSHIAIYEQRADPINALVVSKMQIAALKDIGFQDVTFHVPGTTSSAPGTRRISASWLVARRMSRSL